MSAVCDRGWDYTPRPMGWIVYQIAMAAGLLAAAPFLLVRRGRHYLETLPGRLGRHPDATGTRGGLWIHAVSVGEVAVAATFARSLPESLPLIVTTVTPTGQRRAREAFANRRAVTTYLPFDFGFALSRFFDRFAPAALVLVEGDYWPLAMRFAGEREMPVAVVNARVSRRSYDRLKRLGRRAERLFFKNVGRFGVQTEEDRRRLIGLGVAPERITTTGNLKYDSPEPPPLPELEALVRRAADRRAVLVAGSTMRGEEALVLDAFARIGNGRRALLVLVPRHPERWDAVARLVEERGLRILRRSRPEDVPGRSEVDVLLLDSLGELASLYRVATAAFIGGTLVPTGGHNPLEPARFAVPIVVGPSMENFREIAEGFDRAEAWRRVADAGGLAEAWIRWLDRAEEAAELGRRGGEILEANRGALERTLEMLDPMLAIMVRDEATSSP